MYKLTDPKGWDFYSHTINYRDAIGSIVRVTDYDPRKIVCGKGLHASRNPNNCFVGAKIPCAAFKVKGIQKIAGDKKKSRYRALKVVEEIKNLNNLFGWNYSEAINPVNPFELIPPQITDKEIKLLCDWASVVSLIMDTEWSMTPPVGCMISPVRYMIWDMLDSTIVSETVKQRGDYFIVWNKLHTLIKDAVSAYIMSLSSKKRPKKGTYLFQPAVDLWRMGLVPAFNGKLWCLYGGRKPEILWKGRLPR